MTSALAEKLTAYGDEPFRVVVVGGGATGLETAAQIKGAYPSSDVQIVTQGQVGAFKGARVRRHIAAAMKEQSISLRENCRVIKIEPRGVVLELGCVPADIVVWAGGSADFPTPKNGPRWNDRLHSARAFPRIPPESPFI